MSSPAPAPAPELEVPVSIRVAFGVGSTLVALLAAEGVVRAADGNALPTLGLFATAEGGAITLRADASARLTRPDGTVYTITIDTNGLRAEPAAGRWLAVGDSQVLGMGVAGADTFSAHAGLRNAGVPGYGVADACARAEALLPILRPDGVLFVVNQANDWDEGLTPAASRLAVRGGWLVTAANADAASAWFWASPLSRMHLLYHGWMRLSSASPLSETATLAGLGGAAPVAATTAALAGEIRSFAAAHPGIRTVAAFLPVDAATSSARAAVSLFRVAGAPWTDTSLRDALRADLGPVPLVDLLPALAAPDSFLDGDYHLSAAGHERVATALAPALVAP